VVRKTLQTSQLSTPAAEASLYQISRQLTQQRRKSKSNQQLQEIQKNQQRQQSRFTSPSPDAAAHGKAAGKHSKCSNKRARVLNPNASRLGHYENEMKEVVDAARTLLSIYLLAENAFPGDEVPPTSTMQHDFQGPVKWRKVLDHFFYEAVGANEDASRIGMFQTPSAFPY